MDVSAKSPSASLCVQQIVADLNDRLLPPKAILHLSSQSFEYLKSTHPDLKLKEGSYVWLKGEMGTSSARVLVNSSKASLGPQDCALSSVLSLSLFHTTKCLNSRVQIIPITPKAVVATSLELSLCPFYLNSLDAERKLIPSLPSLYGPLAALVIPSSTAMNRGSFFVSNWFNRLDLIHVVDCASSTPGDSTPRSSSALDPTIYLSTSTTAIKFIPWRETFLSPRGDLNAPISQSDTLLLPSAESVKASLKSTVGGLNRIVNELVDASFAALLNPSFTELPRGFLFCGVSGSGKTHLAKEFANKSGLKPVVVNAPELFRSGEGATEVALSEVFNLAVTQSPSVIVLDELEAIASNRKGMEGAIERRLLTHFLTLLDNLWRSWNTSGTEISSSTISGNSKLQPAGGSRGPVRVLVIGICSSIAGIDHSITRPKRLERIFHFNIPTPSERLDILRIQTKHFPKLDYSSAAPSHTELPSTPSKPSTRDQDIKSLQAKLSVIERVAQRTPGFTGSDLANLCRHTLLDHLKTHVNGSIHDDPALQSQGSIDMPPIPFETFESALSVIKASALSSYSTNHATVSFDEIRGIDDIINSLKASLIAPFEEQERFKKLGAQPPSGVLLYGPPGVGKSKLAMAIASQSKVNFLTVNATEIISKIVGESEQNLSKLFDSARAASPCILFIDQIEAIARMRGSDSTEESSSDRILSLLLTQMDGMEKHNSNGLGSDKSDIDNALIVLAATNKPHLLDTAILRPGRFDHVLYVPPPTVEMRRDMIDLFVTKTPCQGITDAQWNELAKLTRGFTGADLESLFREASYLALKKDIAATHVAWQDLMDVLPTVPGSLLTTTVTHPYNRKVGFSFFS